MNIFFLDEDPKISAIYNVDAHVIKIITEINQQLACAYPNGFAPYKHSHRNHPMTRWCISSLSNFNLAIQHGEALCAEYTYRYEKTHKGEAILNWYKNNAPKIPDIGLTNQPRCFSWYIDLINISDSVVEDYREYYRLAKSHLFKWKKREKPNWI